MPRIKFKIKTNWKLLKTQKEALAERSKPIKIRRRRKPSTPGTQAIALPKVGVAPLAPDTLWMLQVLKFGAKARIPASGPERLRMLATKKLTREGRRVLYYKSIVGSPNEAEETFRTLATKTSPRDFDEQD